MPASPRSVPPARRAARRPLAPRAALALVPLLAWAALGGAVPATAQAAGEAARTARAPSPPTRPDVAAGAMGPFLAGRFAAVEADAPAAAQWLGEALRREPDEDEVLRPAFAAAVLGGDAAAVRLARRLPGDQLAALLLAGADAQAGRWDRAESRLRTLPRQGPVQLLQPVLVAWAQFGRGQAEAALQTLRPWTEAGALRGLAALHAAMICDLGNRPRDAERFARLAMAHSAPNLRLATVLAGVLARAGRAEEGGALFDAVSASGEEAALAATPAARRAALGSRAVAGPVEAMAEAQVALGATLRQQGAPGPALVLARTALRLRPGFAAATLLAAEATADERHPEAAAAMLAELPADDPLGPWAALRRAEMLDRAGRTDEAAAALTALAEAHPAAAQPVARLGDLLRARGRHAEAVTAYDEALRRLGPSASASAGAWPLFYARGIALERSDAWPRAEADFQRALLLSPEQPFVLNYLAYTWAERGEHLAEAREMLERALARQPDDGNIADSMGWVLFRLGEHAAAVPHLERAAELESRSSVINDHLGDAYWAVGRFGEARFQWARALDLEPEAAEIPRLQAKLGQGLPAAAAAH